MKGDKSFTPKPLPWKENEMTSPLENSKKTKNITIPGCGPPLKASAKGREFLRIS